MDEIVLNFTVKIPEQQSGISRKKIKGTTYIYYEHGRKYYSDKQYTVPQFLRHLRNLTR